MAQRVFHGLERVTPELKEVINACTNCLMCRELCGVLKTGRLKFSKRLKKRVVYHDACHLGRGTGVYEEPRNSAGNSGSSTFGNAVQPPLVVVRWRPEAGPELAHWSAAERMREAAASGAELVLTSSALCARSFADLI